ncbi:MAG: hypothetical protein ABJL57_15140 [Hyphomonas sp.]|jgi:hypothetical protein|uniref:hypothetical protein n=1 Tax=Hyphomonas sp. TaxID=87 RepID=UPI003266C5F8|tara:strand:- start:8382 stop:8633 length:252 start_codon:yes stop_codon:yes gene_type:complete
MTRKTLDHLAYPRTTAKEAEEIQQSADRRRAQMVPGKGPAEPPKEDPVSHFKGDDEPVVLGAPTDRLPEMTEDPTEDDEAEEN